MAFGLSSLTDIFTGAPQQKAAEQQQAFLEQQRQAEAARVAAAQATGTTALQAGQTGALGAIQGGTGQARSDIIGNAPQALSALYGGQTLGAGALTSGQEGGLAALQSGVTGAQGAYAPLQGISGQFGADTAQASQATADALGLNGPEGSARATASFRASPGYEYQVGQGIDALTRAANVGGQVAGGNVLRQAQTYGQGQADQDWQSYLANLQSRQGLYAPLTASTAGTAASGEANAALTGGTGAANIYTGTGGKLSDLYSGTGTNAANIYTGQGTSLANLAATGGAQQAGVYTGTGTGIANLVSGLTGQEGQVDQATFAPQAKSYSDAAAAQTGGSANLWGLGLQALTFGAGGGLNPASYGQLFGSKGSAAGRAAPT